MPLATWFLHKNEYSKPSEAINLQNILKGVQAECTLCSWENLAEQDFRVGDIFRRNFYEPLLGHTLQAYKPWACSAQDGRKPAVSSRVINGLKDGGAFTSLSGVLE